MLISFDNISWLILLTDILKHPNQSLCLSLFFSFSFKLLLVTERKIGGKSSWRFLDGRTLPAETGETWEGDQLKLSFVLIVFHSMKVSVCLSSVSLGADTMTLWSQEQSEVHSVKKRKSCCGHWSRNTVSVRTCLEQKFLSPPEM